MSFLKASPTPRIRYESLEIGGDPDLHGRLYAPAYAVHDERHQLLIVVDPEDVSKVLEGPVCAPGPLVVKDVVEPGRLIELVDQRERVIRADAVRVRNLEAAALSDANVGGSPQGRPPLVQALEVAVRGRVERCADASPCPGADDVRPCHGLEAGRHLLPRQTREPGRA